MRILHTIPIESVLALSATCRSLRSLLGKTGYMDRVVKEAIFERDGSLRWLLPVPTLPGEVERANDAGRAWLRDIDAAEPPIAHGEISSPLSHPSFPHLAFLRACFDSDSMRNRQRYWNIAKQFEVLWRDYRTKGWERDIISAYRPAT